MPTSWPLFIISNSPIMRMGLQTIFLKDSLFSVQTHSVEEVDRIIEYEVHPRLFLLDIDQCTDFREVARRIKWSNPEDNIVALVPAEHQRLVLESVRLKVDAIIDKSSQPSMIFTIVKMLCSLYPSELILLSPQLWSHPVAANLLNMDRKGDKGGRLTAREMEILVLLDQGFSNVEMAARLVISLHTVKRHVEHLIRKLNAKDRHDCVRLAHARGLLRTPRTRPPLAGVESDGFLLPPQSVKAKPAEGQKILVGDL